VQPTDPQSPVGFRVLGARGPRRNEREACNGQQGLVGAFEMKAKLVRIVMALSSVGMIALAGGASLRGF
jgi:hypothetical protein